MGVTDVMSHGTVRLQVFLKSSEPRKLGTTMIKPSGARLLTVGEVARRAGVATSALRFYEDARA